MKRSEFQIGCAAVGDFIWLGGLYAAIRGLVYVELTRKNGHLSF